MAKLPNISHCGLPGIDRIPVGMHACHFYRDRKDLVAALVPYVIAGLRANERCIVVTAPPLPASEALQELRTAFDGTDDAVRSDALRVLDFDRWYTGAGGLKGLEVVQYWLDEEERALADGYNGLRISGNASFLEPEGWRTFMEYERAVTTSFDGRRIIALCSYPHEQCGEAVANEVRQAHHCALQRPDNYWQVVPSGPKSARAD